jgi:hypothetical protein
MIAILKQPEVRAVSLRERGKAQRLVVEGGPSLSIGRSEGLDVVNEFKGERRTHGVMVCRNGAAIRAKPRPSYTKEVGYKVRRVHKASKFFIHSVPERRRLLPVKSWKKEVQSTMPEKVDGYCYLADPVSKNLGPYPRLKTLLSACPGFNLHHLFLFGTVLHYDITRTNKDYLAERDLWLFYDFPVGADSYFGKRHWQTPGLCYLKDPDAFYIGSWPTLLDVAENFNNFDFSKVVAVSEGKLHYDSSLPSSPVTDEDLVRIMSIFGNWRMGADNFIPNWDVREANPLHALFFAADVRIFQEVNDDSSNGLATTVVDSEGSSTSDITQDTAPETVESEMFEEPWQNELGGYSAVVKRFWRKNMYDFGMTNLYDAQISLRRKVVQDLDLDYPMVPRLLFVEINHVRTESFPNLDYVFHADQGKFPRLYQTRPESRDPDWLDIRRVDAFTTHFSDVHAIFQALDRRMFLLLEDKRPFMWLSTEYIYKARLKAQIHRLMDARTADARRSLFNHFKHGVSNFQFATLLLAMNLRVIYSNRKDSVVAYYDTGSRGEHQVDIQRAGYVLHYDEDDLATVYWLYKDVIVLLDAPPKNRTYFCADFVSLFQRCVARDIFPERVQAVFELLRICAHRRVHFDEPATRRVEYVNTSYFQTNKVLRFYRRTFGDDIAEPVLGKFGVYGLPEPRLPNGDIHDYPLLENCVFENFDITVPAMEAGQGCCAVKLVNCDVRRVQKYMTAERLLNSWTRRDAIQGFAYFTLVGCVRNRSGPRFPVYHVENFGVVQRETLVELHRQRAFIGLNPITFYTLQVGSLLAAYFGVIALIDRSMDLRETGNYCPGYCYKRVTDEDLGAWPTLRLVLQHATKNLHLSVTSNGFWCHIHTYVVPNSLSVAALIAQFSGTEHWSRWDVRVGAPSLPIAQLIPVEDMDKVELERRINTMLDRVNEINYNVRNLTHSIRRMELLAVVVIFIYLTSSEDDYVKLLSPSLALVLWYRL